MEQFKQRGKTKGVIITLIVIIVLLLGVIVYTYIVQPRFNDYVTQKQVEAQQMVIASLIQSLNTQGQVQITDANGQTITLRPVPQEQAN